LERSGISLFEQFLVSPDNLVVPGASESSLAFLFWCAHLKSKRPVIAIVPEAIAHMLTIDLSTFHPAKVLPGWDVELDCGIPPSSDTVRMRLEVLYSLVNGDDLLLVVTPKGCLQPLWDPDSFLDSLLVLVKNMEVDREDLIQHLADAGYRRVPLVEDPGGFSIRGSVIDVFPPGEELPFRVELWDDEVESIRRFHPATQCSIEQVGRLQILPAKEPLEELSCSLWSLLPKDSLLFLVEPEIVASELEALETQGLPGFSLDDIATKFNLVKVNGVDVGFSLPFAPAPWSADTGAGAKRVDSVTSELKALIEDGYHCYCFIDGGLKACERVRGHLLDRGIVSRIDARFVACSEPGFTLLPGNIHRGFLWLEGPWAFVSGEEIWGRRRVRSKHRKMHLRRKKDLAPVV
jgi:hypothetical protein